MVVESFSTLTEFAVAIAGFSGIAIVLSGRERAISPLTWIRNISLLCASLGAAFGSVVPPLLTSFGATSATIWASSSAFLACVCAVLVLIPVLGVRHLSPAERAQSSPYVWAVALVGNPVVGGWLVLNCTGVLGVANAGPAYSGVVWLLLYATIMFVRMLASFRATPAA